MAYLNIEEDPNKDPSDDSYKKLKMKTCFFTICDSLLQKGLPNSRNLDFKGFVNSFTKFHPDIELVIFDETDMAKQGVNYYNAKATFGRILSEQYELVVNVDADHYFFDRCDEILAGDYDVACPANFNETDNLVGIKVSSGITGNGNPNWLVDEKQFLQGGLIASPNKQFWKHYEHAVNLHYKKFVCFENDVLNIVAYTYPYKVKVLDGHYDYRNENHTQWYGCSIIGKEKKCFVSAAENRDYIFCEDKPVKAYHFAHGSAKKKYTDIFPFEVCQFIEQNIIA